MSNLLKQLYLLAWLIVLSATAQAQQYSMRNYNMDDGLSHSNVYRIFQDHRGFLWFCTDYGLSSFDGRSFHTYLNNDSLLNGAILSMSEDKDGTKLVSAIKEGVLQLTDSSVSVYPLKPGYQLNRYVLYAIPKGNRVWIIARESGQFLYESISGEVRRINFKDATDTDVIFKRAVICDDELLFPTSDGLYRITDTVVHPFLHNITREAITDVKKAADGTYWLGLKNKVLAVKDGKVTYAYELSNGRMVSNILCDRHGNTWVALYGEGMLLIHDGVTQDITSRLTMRKRLINDMYEDREGNIWIATYDAGVYKISSLDILNYRLEDDQLNIFCYNLAPMPGNRLLISSIGKVCIWDNGRAIPIPFSSIRQDDFVYFARYHNGLIYIGTPRGVYTKDATHLNKPEQRLYQQNSGAIAMSIDHTGKILIGGYQYFFHIENNAVLPDTSDPLIRVKRFNAVIEDHAHNLWLGLHDGIIRYDGKKYARYPLPAPKNLRTVHALAEDSHGRIWVATDGGLICIEGDKQKIFTQENGLNHNRCNRIVEDKHNTLWVGTLHGLSYIDLNTLDIKSYAGIYSDEVLSLYCNDSNTLFVGTANGLSSIRTNRVFIDDSPPSVYITSIRSTGIQANMPREVYLPYNKSKLDIDFIGLSFQDPQTVEYRYKIQGLDDNWHLTRNSSIEIPSLPSGRYTFLLNARRNKGKWSSDVMLRISVATPFWKTWWFLSVMSISVVTVVSFVTRRYIVKQELKKRQQLSLYNKVAYLKQQALSALINPHFIFNCMNSIQHYLNKNDNEKANIYLADFAHLIRMTMENAQDAFIDLDKEITRIKLYLSLEQLRIGDDLLYEIKIDDELAGSHTRIPNMILQPYIENAIWHGLIPKDSQGNILISFEQHNAREIRITIADNGIGIRNSKKLKNNTGSRHFGMKLTEERLQLLRQLSHQHYAITVKELTGKDGWCIGTSVEIIVPAEPGEADIDQLEEDLKV